jgi:hypothetical protein
MEENSITSVTTRATGIRYGLILGVISILYFVIFDLADLDMSKGIGQWGTSLIALPLLFFAHKYFKENGDGFMSFGQGVGIGFWTGLISSVASSIFVFIYVSFINDNYLTKARDKAIEDMQAKGQSEDQIEMAMKFVDMFLSPGAMLLMGIIFGTIILVVLSLIISIFTQKPRPEQVG